MNFLHTDSRYYFVSCALIVSSDPSCHSSLEFVHNLEPHPIPIFFTIHSFNVKLEQPHMIPRGTYTVALLLRFLFNSVSLKEAFEATLTYKFN